MKKISLFALMGFSFIACKKDGNNIKANGTKFDFVGSPLSTLAQNINGKQVIPTDPFVIDKCLGTYSDSGSNFYEATSSNGLIVYIYQSNMDFNVSQN